MKGKKPISVGYYPSYIGNVIIPDNIDRREFVSHCLKTNSVLIRSVDNMIETNVAVGKESIKQIKFPKTANDFGSTVLCITNLINGVGKVAAVYNTPDEVQEIFEENQWSVIRRNGDNFVMVDLQGNSGEFHIISDSSGNSVKSSIKLLNESNSAYLDVFIQGILNFIVENEININSQEGINLTIRNGKKNKTIINYKQNEGFKFIDEFGNNIKTSKDGVDISKNKNELKLEDDGFTIKNNKSDLKSILNSLTMILQTSVVQTPSGPGMFDANTLNKLNKIESQVNKLFK